MRFKLIGAYDYLKEKYNLKELSVDGIIILHVSQTNIVRGVNWFKVTENRVYWQRILNMIVT
jgi:hypothetical protein